MCWLFAVTFIACRLIRRICSNDERAAARRTPAGQDFFPATCPSTGRLLVYCSTLAPP
jgi:hypothetical protein